MLRPTHSRSYERGAMDRGGRFCVPRWLGLSSGNKCGRLKRDSAYTLERWRIRNVRSAAWNSSRSLCREQSNFRRGWNVRSTGGSRKNCVRSGCAFTKIDRIGEQRRSVVASV
jgi:hypothetical protein